MDFRHSPKALQFDHFTLHLFEMGYFLDALRGTGMYVSVEGWWTVVEERRSDGCTRWRVTHNTGSQYTEWVSQDKYQQTLNRIQRVYDARIQEALDDSLS